MLGYVCIPICGPGSHSWLTQPVDVETWMEEKNNKRHNESRAPNMKIDEKMQQEGSKNNEKIKKIGVRGCKNRGKSGGGCLQEATKLEVGKNRGSL